jgi:hypothetical protein
MLAFFPNPQSPIPLGYPSDNIHTALFSAFFYEPNPVASAGDRRQILGHNIWGQLIGLIGECYY